LEDELDKPPKFKRNQQLFNKYFYIEEDEKSQRYTYDNKTDKITRNNDILDELSTKGKKEYLLNMEPRWKHSNETAKLN
jgi:hypothetical protein